MMTHDQPRHRTAGLALLAATLVALAALTDIGSPALSAQPLVLAHLADIPSPNGCAAATMTVRRDEAGRPFLYVAAKDAGLRIYDVSAQPRLVTTVSVGALRGLDVMSLTQAGFRLFLALGDSFGRSAESPGLAVLDVGDPTRPFVVDLWSDSRAKGGSGMVAVEGDFAYLAAMGNGLLTFRLSANDHLTLVSRFVPPLSFPDARPDKTKINARGLVVRQGIVYLAYDAGGLRIVDARNPARPVQIGRWANPALKGKPRAYNNVVVDGDRAYVTVDYCGLEVLDVARPGKVRMLSWWNPWSCASHPLSWFVSEGHTNEIAFDADCQLLFMAAGKSDLVVVDIADPTRPQQRASYPGFDNGIGTWGLSRHQDRLYLAYICTPLPWPFASNWSGVKELAYDRDSCGRP
jgi:hypothetical protein